MDKVAASELEIYISNSRELMLRRLPEFIKNVARKMKRGTYDPMKSVKLWRYLVDEAAKMYAKEYGGKWNEMFTVPTRNAVAMELERDYAAQIRDGNWSHVLDAAKIKLNPASRSGVRVVHNKLLGGWYVVRGPHQTPISGRFDSKAEAQAWLNRNKANPAARKKKVAAKKKTATRKKTAAKKKTTARKKIAVNAKSRATGKAPSARLKKRRARNTMAGAYPNPAKRKTGTGWGGKEYIVFAVEPGKDYGARVWYYAGGNRLTSRKPMAARFTKRGEAEKSAQFVAETLPAEKLIVGVADGMQNADTIRAMLRERKYSALGARGKV